ncbi:tetratricopeptide repeat protein [Xanthobacter variabilis]|uniref:tetratricopeptide repeat protein n=1 Tax=Xanthobacter variabilis TaxID=3119932 RepID=UPI003727470B
MRKRFIPTLLAMTAGLAAACVIAFGTRMPEGRAQAQTAVMELAPGGIGGLDADAPHAGDGHGNAMGHVGSAACASCHADETRAWLSSHHAAAMALATPETVRGDFDDVRVSVKGASARFFRDGPRYMVETDGPDGRTETFEISHVFGVTPLQQYLVTFPDGRLQALPFAFDTRPKADGGQRWFHLYPDAPPVASDPMHWTKLYQNWNFMCAECHSTAVARNYDPAADTFHTTFSEVSVGCESCHGPGAAHVAWAKGGADPNTPHKGFPTVAAARAEADFTPDPHTGSPAKGASRAIGDEVEGCARCHARRGIFSEHWRPGLSLTDTHLPTLLSTGLFEDDGQMRDEVFNDHSFKQSLMYSKGVVCSDCHDPHSGRLKAEGAQVCSQCHLPEKFETTAHTGHAPGPKAPDCISCHMPVRTYMGVDRRHDHSFRIPRPDRTVSIGTPNTCNDCHADKSAAWAAEAVARWHGPDRKGFQTWAEPFHAARAGDPAARSALLRLAQDAAVPGLVRATALAEVQRFPSAATAAVNGPALSDPDPMVRVVALRSLAGLPPQARWQRGSTLLDDPSPVVRLEVASLLADVAPNAVPEADRDRLIRVFGEYEAAQKVNADRPEGRGNLATFLARQGDIAGAERELKAGLKLDPSAASLAVNLADLYRTQGREQEAEAVLRDAIAHAPTSGEAQHALGLSLVRQKRLVAALDALGRAVALAPDTPRYAYVYAVALQTVGRGDDARRVAREALERTPFDADLLALALQDALRARDVARAAPLAERLSQMRPDDMELARMVQRLGATPGPR